MVEESPQPVGAAHDDRKGRATLSGVLDSALRDLILLGPQVSVFCTVFAFGLEGDRGGHALSNACRHPSIALAIASANVPDQQFGATVLLYVIMNATLCIPYVVWQRVRTQLRSA
jgi:hypothetical protein